MVNFFEMKDIFLTSSLRFKVLDKAIVSYEQTQHRKLSWNLSSGDSAVNITSTGIQAVLNHIAEKLPFDTVNINISVMWLLANSALTSELTTSSARHVGRTGQLC